MREQDHAGRDRQSTPPVTNARSVFQWMGAIFSVVTLGGCEILGDIFQAGIWTGVLLVVAILVLIVWAVSKTRTRKP